MKTKICIAFAFILGLLAGHLTLPAAYSQFRTTKSTNLMTKDVSGWCAGREVTVELNEIQPGTSGKHYHPAHSFTYVLDGTESYELEGEPAKMVHAGDVLYEAPMQVHTVANGAPVKLLVVRLIEKGKDATVRLP